jgi:hypothetical protein
MNFELTGERAELPGHVRRFISEEIIPLEQGATLAVAGGSAEIHLTGGEHPWTPRPRPLAESNPKALAG